MASRRSLCRQWLMATALLVISGVHVLRYAGLEEADYRPPAEIPLEIKLDRRAEIDAGLRQVWSYRSSTGSRVPVWSIRPAGGTAAPAIVFLYGAGMDMTCGQKVADLVTQAGFSLHIPEQMGCGRRRSAQRSAFQRALIWRRRAWHLAADARRLVDALQQRSDISPDGIYFWGASFGVLFGCRALAQDDRFRAGVFTLGGADFPTLIADSPAREKLAFHAVQGARCAAWLLAPLDPVRTAGDIDPRPLLLQNALEDDLIPRSAAQALRDAAGPGAEQRWYELTHEHIDRQGVRQLFHDGLDWLVGVDRGRRLNDRRSKPAPR